MAFPSRYPPDLIDAVVQRVADARAIKAYGAVTTVARQLNLDPRLVQKWVTKATTPVAHQPARPAAGVTEPWETYLPPGLLHCRFCHQPMTQPELPDCGQTYQCQPGCRPRPLDAAAVADTVGRAILRHATKIVPTTGTPTPPHLAAIHAHRVLTRVTVGATPTDITLTWRTTPISGSDQFEAERAHRIGRCPRRVPQRPATRPAAPARQPHRRRPRHRARRPCAHRSRHAAGRTATATRPPDRRRRLGHLRP